MPNRHCPALPAAAVPLNTIYIHLSAQCVRKSPQRIYGRHHQSTLPLFTAEQFAACGGEENIQEWLKEAEIYQIWLPIYFCTISLWLLIGFLILGFTISGLSAKENLLLNFLLFLTLAAAISFPTFCYDCIVGRKRRQHTTMRWLEHQTSLIDDIIRREVIWSYVCAGGTLAPRRLQRFTFIFIVLCILFELFLVNAWIRDMQIVWQPDWLTAVIDWVRNNTDDFSDRSHSHSVFKTGKIFLSDISSSEYASFFHLDKNF